MSPYNKFEKTYEEIGIIILLFPISSYVFSNSSDRKDYVPAGAYLVSVNEVRKSICFGATQKKSSVQ